MAGGLGVGRMWMRGGVVPWACWSVGVCRSGPPRSVVGMESQVCETSGVWDLGFGWLVPDVVS
jgi:hypothetical protein